MIKQIMTIIFVGILFFSSCNSTEKKITENNKSENKQFIGRFIGGVSMGGYGAALLGTKYHNMFDSVVIMGGPTDWTYLLWHVRNNLIGGFIDSEKDNNIKYEKWFVGIDNTFERDEHIKLFQDLTLAFGNFLTYNPVSTYWPVGVENNNTSYISRITDPACNNEYQINNFFDDEYNNPNKPFCNSYPNHISANSLGLWPVITFCDGGDRNNNGIPDSNEIQNKPVEIALAVDCNGNGKRDLGEPVIRDTNENFQDTGTDGLFDEDEAGYDPVNNPDPNGDDYHFWKNPTGTEGNLYYDKGEPFEDYGIDGINNTKSYKYDFGEGNGQFDYNPNIKNIWNNNPFFLLDNVDFNNTTFYFDAGVKDTFFFQEGEKRMIGKFKAMGLPATYYEGFDKIPLLSQKEVTAETDFSMFFDKINWNEVPDNFLVLYGRDNLTIPEAIKNLGDGGHVGNFAQVLMRVLGAFYYISEHIPDSVEKKEKNTAIGDAGAESFYSEIMGHTLKYSISLPPGYKDCKDRYYPVVYFLHGYGMDADGMWATGLAINLLMSMGKIKDMIIVFPDGHSINKVQGSFFVNHKDNSGQDNFQYEDYIIKELIPYIEKNYRTLPSLNEIK